MKFESTRINLALIRKSAFIVAVISLIGGPAAYAFSEEGLSSATEFCHLWENSSTKVEVELLMMKSAVADMYSHAADECAKAGKVATQVGPMEVEDAAQCRNYRSGRFVTAEFSCTVPLHIEERPD